MDDEQIRTLVGDAFVYAHNVLLVCAMDMIDREVSDDRLTWLLNDLDDLNEQTLSSAGKEIVTGQLATVLAAVRSTRPRGKDRSGEPGVD